MTPTPAEDYGHPNALHGPDLLEHAEQVRQEILAQLPKTTLGRRYYSRLKAYRIVLNPRLTRTYGYCRYGRRQIDLSVPLSEVNDREYVQNTIRHEFAHALVGPGASAHGTAWKKACTLTGANPIRCYDRKVQSPPRWAAFCRECGTHVGNYRTKDRAATWNHDCPACGTRSRPGTSNVTDRRTYLGHAEKENTMSKYTLTITQTLDGETVTNTVERARKDDAMKHARKHEAFGATCVVRTPTGKVVHETVPGEDTPATQDEADDGAVVTAATPKPKTTYRRDRIPAGATEHECESCSRTLPVTKFPTTRDRSRLTECRECRDTRRAKA